MVPLSQPLLSRRLLSSLLTSPVVLGYEILWAQDMVQMPMPVLRG